MKKTLLFFLMVAWVALAQAIPAKPGLKRTLTLANGTTIQATLVGDEFGHFYIGTDGKAYNMQKGKAYYEEVNAETIKTKAQARRLNENLRRSKRMNVARVGEVGSYFGKKKGIVILVNYTDVKWNSNHTLAYFKRIANEENFKDGDFKGSMYDYFKAQSEGQFELTFDVVGPVTVTKGQSYYGGNDSGGNDQYPASMVIEACKLADSQVNFADYDWDGDGYVDQVYVVYAGQGEADGGSDDTVWPHAWSLADAKNYGDGSGTLTLDGVKIDTYACGSELNGSNNLEGIGTMCHEFSHCLGYPDFYDIDYSGGQGMYSWDLMDNGSYNDDGYQPAGYTSYERWVAGWKEPIELSASQAVTGMKGLQDGGDAYIIYNDNNRDEYFMLENRTQTGWDASLPGGGMLIVHVDYDATAWNNNGPNDTPSHQRMTWVPSDGNYNASYQTYGDQKYVSISDANLAKDLWPQTGKTTFGPSTTGNTLSKLWNKNSEGGDYLTVSVLDIAKDANGLISFNFQGLSNVATPTFTPAAGRYNAPQEVSITCKTDDTEIYYTLDGTTPSANSTHYTAPFTVSETTTVKAVAISVTGEESNVGIAKYTIIDGNQLLYEGLSKYTSEGDATSAIETSDADLDYDGWTELTKVYKGGTSNAKENGGCLKLGSSKAVGSMTASNIALTGNGTLAFSVKKYGNDTGKLTVSVTGATADVTEFTPAEDWSDCTVNLTGATGNVSITLATTAKRAYVDEIELLASGSSNKQNVTMSFSPASVEATIGEAFTAPTLTMNPAGFSVTYSSSNTSVATVTEAGEVTLKAAGTAVITARFAGNDEYNSASASYTLTVKNAGGTTGGEGKDLPYENTLLGSHTDFTINDVATGGLTAVWKDNATYGMVANGYKCTGDIESWLISPLINATSASAPSMKFSHGVNFFASIDKAKEETGVYIREGETGQWQQLTVDYPASLGNTFKENVEVDLSQWAGKEFQIGFKFTATTTNPGRWQIKNISIADNAAPVIEVPTLTPSKTSAAQGETVTITVSQANFDSDEGAIWYTTDGSDPTTSSTKSVLDDSTFNTINVTMGTADVVVKAVATTDGQTFSAVASVTIAYKESQGGDATVVTLPYSNTLLSATIPEGFSVEGEESIWTFTTNYGVKATSGSKVEKEAYLVSPFVDMTSATAPKMQFEHAGKFFGTPADEATLWAREEGGAWQQVTIPTYFTNTNWNWVVCEIDLTAYAGKKVQFGFKYNSTTANYGTWEIKNLNIADGEVVITYEDHTIASLNQATAAIEHVNLTLNNAIVTYVETPRVYVREGDESILFYNTGLNLTKGNTISGTVKVKLDIYKGLREVVKITDVTNADDLTITAPSAEPVATEKTLAQILAGESVSDLVAVKGVTIEYEAPAATTSAPADVQRNAADEAGTYYAVSGSDKVLIYNNNFTAVTLTADMNGKQYDIEGVVSVYNNTPQLMPTKMTDVSTGINGLTNDEAEQSGAIYNLSGQRVDRNYKGIVIVNGKKLLKK